MYVAVGSSRRATVRVGETKGEEDVGGRFVEEMEVEETGRSFSLPPRAAGCVGEDVVCFHMAMAIPPPMAC